MLFSIISRAVASSSASVRPWNALQALKGIILTPPQGAFYAFPRLPDGAPDSMEFCRQALEQEGRAGVPGRAFGDDRCIRRSCAIADATIHEGLLRLKRLLRSF